MFVGIGLVFAALAIPVTAVAIHQGRRRRKERAAGYRRKERIEL